MLHLTQQLQASLSQVKHLCRNILIVTKTSHILYGSGNPDISLLLAQPHYLRSAVFKGDMLLAHVPHIHESIACHPGVHLPQQCLGACLALPICYLTQSPTSIMLSYSCLQASLQSLSLHWLSLMADLWQKAFSTQADPIVGCFQELRSKGLLSETGQGGEVMYPLGEPGAFRDHRLPGPTAMMPSTRCLPSHLQVGVQPLS